MVMCYLILMVEYVSGAIDMFSYGIRNEYASGAIDKFSYGIRIT